MENYAYIGHHRGFKAKRGKSAEFNRICEEIFSKESELKFACLYYHGDSEGDNKIEGLHAQIAVLDNQLKEVGVPYVKRTKQKE